ncbi:MAG TPA: 23S rRNA (pseudouridine(1915)-N(3))-methyltransferase RlmH [Rhodospirillaceae bacterium]|nr:MAG: 23S rRNA (pseudouridine(1915)-N(3))-methyltransferase RlmH [Alphaproteobacteria bacterium GWF2_58_20]HAU28871.1 23S rRNA (pseudouridine(1915)-N(3))-methyltransferase RlmH [Rhodospirillaceae bacterium]
MKLTILAVGRMKSGPTLDSIKEYQRRMETPLAIREVECKKALDGPQKMAEEGHLLMDALPEGARLVAMDEHGKNLGSREFAALIQNEQDNGCRDLVFVIGGADGLSEDIRKRAFTTLSFGKLTWPHMLARLMLAEQLYRAQQILKGHPYHRD